MLSAYIQVEITAEDVVTAMTEEGPFALEMWQEINEKLHMGMLLDDACDLVKGNFGPMEKRMFISSLRLIADSVEQDMLDQGEE